MSIDYPSSYAPAQRANTEYNYAHNEFSIGFLEIDGAEAKIYEMAIEANQFYEI